MHNLVVMAAIVKPGNKQCPGYTRSASNGKVISICCHGYHISILTSKPMAIN